MSAAGPGAAHDLVLLRHGETAWSLSGQHTGTTDIPLTARGEDQARSLAPVLARWRFAAAWSSPRQRAQRTAQLARLVGVRTSDDLVEWDYGAYEGRRTVDIQAERDAAGLPRWVLWRDGVPPGSTPGEDAAGVAERVDRFLGRIAPDLARGPVLAVAHAHVLRVLTARWLGLPPAQGSAFPLAAGHLCVLGHEHGLPTIDRWNAPPPGDGA